VSPGALITPGSPITTLDDISVIKLDFPIPEAFLATLEVGQQVIARSVTYPDRIFQGQVSSIASRVDPVTRAVMVRAVLPNPDQLLKPGKLLTVELIKDRRQSLMIPEEALVPLRDRQFVFLVNEDDTVSRMEVDIGRRRPGSVEIINGLSEGQQVVIEGTNRIGPGSPVTVQEVRENRDL
jgi:membrane fusion protein (multidrug efflux system)